MNFIEKNGLLETHSSIAANLALKINSCIRVSLTWVSISQALTVIALSKTNVRKSRITNHLQIAENPVAFKTKKLSPQITVWSTSFQAVFQHSITYWKVVPWVQKITGSNSTLENLECT